MYWPLNDAHLVLFVLSCLPVTTIGSLVSALTRVRRAEFARLQNEVKQLSVKVKALEVAEQRHFLVELKSKTEGKDPLIAASTTKDLAISESRSPNLQLLKDSDAAPPLAS
jgi:hypothetical protein